MYQPLIIGNNIIEVPAATSTNLALASMLTEKKLQEGTILFTLNQTSGRGQMGTKWHSIPHQSLTCSLCLQPKFLLPTQQFYLNMCIALGISDWLISQDFTTVRIKWPNDILIHQKKCTGILIENSINSKQITQSIIGMGINLNQESFPEDLPHAVSLRMVNGNNYDIKETICSLASFLDVRYQQLMQQRFEKLHKDYVDLLWRFEAWHDYQTKDGILRLKITGVDSQGFLITENEVGETNKYSFKEIIFSYN
jgi:BirA family biotin operon repressor/biotin-[acetyl-CoA-carboxylase] ligase